MAGNGDSSVANGNAVIGNGNPLDIVGMPVTVNQNGVVSTFDGSTSPEGRGGVRRVEDLLLTNVHEMKVELWDSRLQRFVFPGHLWTNPATGELGDFHAFRCLNIDAGPLGSMPAGLAPMKAHVFDTWHHDVSSLDFDGSGTVSASEKSAPVHSIQLLPSAFFGHATRTHIIQDNDGTFCFVLDTQFHLPEGVIAGWLFTKRGFCPVDRIGCTRRWIPV